MSEQQFVDELQRYMPEQACKLAYGWIKKFPVKLKVTNPRNTKLGDFRPKTQNDMAQITVNGDLNPYSFTITLAHEIAHLIDFTKRKSLKNAHGFSWKLEYQKLLIELFEKGVFPVEMNASIVNHINKPKAASCSDPSLLAALRKYDAEPVITLNEIPAGSHFTISGNRIFEKGKIRRTRYCCVEVATGKKFLVHGESAVKLS